MGIVIGTQYYRPPNPPRSDWPRDLDRIAEAGLSMIKVWACWSWMEAVPGQVDTSELEELLELAGKRDLKVVVNLILENAPYWLEAENPGARYRSTAGTVVSLGAAINTPGGGWPGLCFDNDDVWEAGASFIRSVVSSLRGYPALAMWDVWNEPHLEPTWYYPNETFCVCDSSLDVFMRGLRQRYEDDLDRLNERWARRYSSWDHVRPPERVESYPDLIEWRTHWLRNLGRWLQRRVETVREIDSQTPVMTHVASSGYLGTLTANVWDEFELSGPVDAFGTSSFPQWLMRNDPAIHGFHLDATRSAGKDKPFWQAELQGGQPCREVDPPTGTPTPDSIRLWMWHALAAGADAILFWQWRPELLGPESPGYGLCSPDGSPTERLEAVARFAEEVRNLPELGPSVDGRIGILVSPDTAHLTFAAEKSMDSYAKSLLGSYRMLFDSGIGVEFLHASRVAQTGVPPSIDAIYWPMPSSASGDLANSLAEFCARGGTLLAEAVPAQHDELGWSQTTLPGLGLDQLFGTISIETHRVDTVDAGAFRGAWLWAPLTPKSAEALTTHNSYITATTHSYGNGTAVLLATLPSIRYEADRDAQTREFVVQTLGLDDPNQELPPGVVVRRRETIKGECLFLINTEDTDLDVALTRAPGFVAAHEGDRQTVRVPAQGGAFQVIPVD